MAPANGSALASGRAYRLLPPFTSPVEPGDNGCYGPMFLMKFTDSGPMPRTAVIFHTCGCICG